MRPKVKRRVGFTRDKTDVVFSKKNVVTIDDPNDRKIRDLLRRVYEEGWEDGKFFKSDLRKWNKASKRMF